MAQLDSSSMPNSEQNDTERADHQPPLIPSAETTPDHLSVGGGKPEIANNLPQLHLGKITNDRALSAVYSAADVVPRMGTSYERSNHWQSRRLSMRGSTKLTGGIGGLRQRSRKITLRRAS